MHEPNSRETMKPVRPKKDSWKEFGDNVESFLDRFGEELKNVDLVLGFTRGGMILATILCTLLRDKFPNAVKNGSRFASLRPLPGGITAKTYRERCFVMRSPMTEEEEEDAKKLVSEIETFKRKYCRTKKKLNILLVDDNLTGATRIFAYKELLSGKPNYLNVRTLGYTRLECFKHPTLDFIIAGYTPVNRYRVMPWHKVHEPVKLPSSDVPSVFLALHGPLNLNELYYELNKVIGIFGTMKIEKDQHLRIYRGATVIYIAKREYGATIRFSFSKYYPPKRCLEEKELIENVDTFGEYSLCSLGAKKADRICFCCSSLNCNRDILKVLLSQSPRSNLEVRQLGENAEKSILTIATKKWLERFKNSVS